MCQCGDRYCDLDDKRRNWANNRHTELLYSQKWIARIPDEVKRDVYLERIVRNELAESFNHSIT